jgi:hypothetical protein
MNLDAFRVFVAQIPLKKLLEQETFKSKMAEIHFSVQLKKFKL